MEEQKLPNIEITELILIRCGNDWSRTFLGTIKRSEDGVIYGQANIADGIILTTAVAEENLCNNLNMLCYMKLVVRIHNLPDNKLFWRKSHCMN